METLTNRIYSIFLKNDVDKMNMKELYSNLSDGNALKNSEDEAKFKAGETLHLVSSEAVQMHGGVGVTDEFDIGFFLKRSRVAEQIFGSSDYHLDRYATLSEY